MKRCCSCFQISLLILTTIMMAGHRNPTFALSIAGNDAQGTAVYPNGGLTHVGTIRLLDEPNLHERNLQCAVIDAAAGFAYFVPHYTIPGRMIKIDLSTFSRVGALSLNPGEDSFDCAVIDPAAGFAYLGTAYKGFPARIVKIDLKTFTRVDAITLSDDEQELRSAVIDPENGFAYFGTARRTGTSITYAGRVVKIDLKTFTRVGAITLNSDEQDLRCAAIDPLAGFAYFGASVYPLNDPARIVKIDLATFTRVGRLVLSGLEERSLGSAVIDSASGFAYFGGGTGMQCVVKIDLATFTRAGAINLEYDEVSLSSAVIDPVAGFAYFGVDAWPAHVVKIDLATFTRAGGIKLADNFGSVNSMVLHPAEGFVYCGNGLPSDEYGQTIKVGLLGRKGMINSTHFTLPEGGAISAAHLYSHTSGGNVRLAIYGDSAIRWRLWESASTSNTKTNDWVNIPISSGTPDDLTLPAGNYWLAWQTDTQEAVGSYTAGNTGEGFLIGHNYGSFPEGFDPSTLTSTNDRWSAYVTYEPRAGVENWEIYK